MQCALKELRETRINLRIIKEKPILLHESVEIAVNECNELIAIFSASVVTAKRNRGK
ncbi:four helix bundle protein [Niabella soli]|uniref:Four helix bundle protein n=1 Tax=Niabella soli DSM 19437 TaxID=929713 RepID=W0EZB7_9BACT|nr:hypothetical protein [Niabella soli]AHF14539.1 hypothetical protein NIASO_03745 [Niabella soli DSM 19437]